MAGHVGCGSGENLELLSRALDARTPLFGVDFSSYATAQASRRLGSSASICVASAKKLPFADESFAHLTVFGLLEHVSEIEVAVAEIARVACSGAEIHITTSNKISALQFINSVRTSLGRYPYGYQRNISLDEADKILSPLKIIQSKYIHADWDMPFVKIFDYIFSLFYRKCSRYIYIKCLKDEER